MESFGIYTLANDVVYDQLVALLNSIEVNVSADIPVCIIPYDERLDRVKQEINSRKNVILFENDDVIQRWEEFAHQIWAAHPRERDTKASRPSWYKSHLQRKFVAFEGVFDQFVFYDGDSLAMKPTTDVIEKLNKYDFVFDDWEHLKNRTVAALDISVIEKTGLYMEADIRPKLHCSSFFGSKRGLFTAQEIAVMKQQLIDKREIEWINGHGWWDDAFLFNYMTLRCDRPLFNFTLSPNGQDRTGNCANADPFVNIDNVLYNQDGLKPIHRIHYMSYSSSDFARLSQGEDVNILYRDEFLYYRFLKQPEQRPQQLKPPNIASKTNRFIKKTIKKIQRTIA
ncbi:Npun_R2821/Npun_R2822 family protein [aff. Roholtiella sp. LEGE 12411]|uniref:Npun_R2821/Npun_R2822 family protein n=1 Tax=aff. Roholtiella sp. LEGE 12411 TaxID=1828822 RepID=UPI00187F1066|nr:Npun_R2821/Npun_R2822 family protein [aff. Roholtiella sp. LEGE 12411]MBE9036578.1 methionine synthase [aff. Roholtiella sp. LEGE 12411]